MINIEKIFEKSEDLIFHSENVKNSYDAKDLIVVIVEYGGNFKNQNFCERAFKLSLKLIQNYLEDPKVYYLKNSNTILFFVFKNERNFDSDMTQFISTQNSITIKNILFNLIKRNVSTSDERENIVDIVSAFIVKTALFSSEDVTELFNKIFNIWRESDNSISNHIGFCLNEIILKYEELNNINLVCKFIDSNLKECLTNDNDSYNEHLDDLIKYFNLLKNYFSNPKISNLILRYLFENINNLVHSTFLNGKKFNSKFCSVFNKISSIVIEILSDKKFNSSLRNDETIDKNISEFIKVVMNIMRSSELEYFNNCVFKDLIRLIRVLFTVASDETIMSVLNLVTENLSFFIERKECSSFKLEKYSIVYFHSKILKLILEKCSNSETIVGGLNLVNVNFSTIIHETIVEFSLQIMKHIERSLIKFSNEETYSEINSIRYEISFFNYRIFSKIVGLSLLNVKKLMIKLYDKMDDESFPNLVDINFKLKKIYEQMYNSHKLSFDSLMNDLNSSDIITKNVTFFVNFELNFIFFSNIISFLIVLNESEIVYYISSFFEKILKLENNKYFEILQNSTLLKIKADLINDANKDLIYKLIYKLKEYYDKSDILNKKPSLPHRFLLHSLLNLYSSFSYQIIDENFDIIIDLTIKTLDMGINIKSSSGLMKKILKHIDKDFVRKRGYNVKTLIESFIKVCVN